jgi:hypothetical protein
MSQVCLRHAALKDMAVIAGLAVQHHEQMARDLVPFSTELLQLQTAITTALLPLQQLPATVHSSSSTAVDSQEAPGLYAAQAAGPLLAAVEVQKEGGGPGSMQVAHSLLASCEAAVDGLRAAITCVLQVRLIQHISCITAAMRRCPSQLCRNHCHFVKHVSTSFLYLSRGPQVRCACPLLGATHSICAQSTTVST